MSGLTDEIRGAIAEIAADLGEGLTATLVRFVDDVGNAPIEQTFAIPPVSEVLRGGADGPEVLRGVLQAVLPTTDTLGAAVVPMIGDRLRVGSTLYQIVGVTPLNIGTGTAGYQCEVRT